MILYKKGDLLKSTGIISHGCNCVGGFGSGVAGQIAAQYPFVKEYYLHKHNNGGWKLGDIQIVSVTPDKLFVNCATQKEYYPRDIVHADYRAIQTILNKLYRIHEDTGLEVNIPKIGCGLAGGDWNIVEKLVDCQFAFSNITVWEL
jgi:O-acetyl-ADP-ribose deacetylase (regulator of RNase III)